MAIICKASVFVWCLIWTVIAHSQSSVGEPTFRPVCPPAVGLKCKARDSSYNDFFYIINGYRESITFMEGNYFEMSCARTPMDDTAWPQFTRPVLFQRVLLKNCVPPKAPTTYMTALQRLNVTVLYKLSINNLPTGAIITRASLADLPSSITELDLATATTLLQLEHDTLDGLEQLQSLVLSRVRPDRLPPRLARLKLKFTKVRSLPGPLDSLERLEVKDSSPKDFTPLANLSKLQELSLEVPLQAVPLLPPKVENVTLTILEVRSPVPFERHGCEHLQRLTVEYWWMARVPAGWVEACPVLHTFRIQMQKNLTELAVGMLRGATELRTLYIMACPIETLPPDLFEYSTKLEEVNLSRNRLKYLPLGLLSRAAGSLKSLDLSSNQLLKQDLCLVVQPLASLENLKVSNNPLGDLCDPQSNDDVYTSEVSCLRFSSKLRLLSLSNVTATRVCIDWLRDMKDLHRLDLSRNNITTLMFSDLIRMMRNQDKSEIDLSHNPVRGVDTRAADYDQALKELPNVQGSVLLDSEFECDCTAYWFWRALRDRRLVVKMEPQCSGGVALRDVPASHMQCELAAEECKPCTCVAAPPPAPGDVTPVRVSCPRAPPPRLVRRPPHPIQDLSLADAELKTVPELLPSDLQSLNLDKNSISRISPERGEALFSTARRVRLTRNPLACDCDPDSFLPLLRAYRHQVEYFNETRCSDGKLAAEALQVECAGAGARTGTGWARGAGVAAALAAGVGAACLLAVLLSRERLRLRLKAWLYARGVRVSRGAEPADRDRLFDVFLSHDAKDRRFVAEHIVPRLEKHGYKLCLSYRDWPPGAWLPTQIEASVAASRRTVAVLCSQPEPPDKPEQHEAGWVRAEVLAAHGASVRERRARLVLVAVGGVPAELREVARHHVCLRWGAPAFWDRLLYALPDPAPSEKLSLP